MDSPPVQYVTTSDGYDIAYTTTGAGTPLVVTPAHFSHTVMDWQAANAGSRWRVAVSERFRMVNYDSRGQGMSTRGLRHEHSIHDYERDLEAVIERASFERFVLFGFLMFGHVAIRFALKHPQRVQALVLLNCRVEGSTGPLPPLEQLARDDWENYLDVITRTISPRVDPTFAKRQSRESVTQSDYLLQTAAFSRSNIREAASALAVPTLLLAAQATNWSFGAESQAQKLAALIPDSRLALFDDTSAGMFAPEGEIAPNILAIEALLAEIAARPADAPASVRPLPETLSERELDVLRLIVAGRSSREIGDDLVLSVRTVERHIANIYLKTDTHGRAQVTAYAMQRGLG